MLKNKEEKGLIVNNENNVIKKKNKRASVYRVSLGLLRPLNTDKQFKGNPSASGKGYLRFITCLQSITYEQKV